MAVTSELRQETNGLALKDRKFDRQGESARRAGQAMDNCLYVPNKKPTPPSGQVGFLLHPAYQLMAG